MNLSTDLLLHTDVRWLSRGTFLEQFSELLSEIKEFLKRSNHAEYAQLDDSQWLLDFAFLTDLTDKVSLELQGKEKHIMNTFKSKLHLLSSRLQQCDLRNFPHNDTELKRQGIICMSWTIQI